MIALDMGRNFAVPQHPVSDVSNTGAVKAREKHGLATHGTRRKEVSGEVKLTLKRKRVLKTVLMWVAIGVLLNILVAVAALSIALVSMWDLP